MPEAIEKMAASKSKTWLAFCFCFILGVGAFSFAGSGKPVFGLYLLLFAILFLLILSWKKREQRFILLCCLAFIFGGFRFLVSIPDRGASEVEFYNGQKVILRGWISREPEIGVSDAKYIVSAESLVDGKKNASVSGKVLVKSRLYPRHNYGDELKINCFLREPENFTDIGFNYKAPHIISFARKSSGEPAASLTHFNYKKYLAKYGVWSICLDPEIISLGGNKGKFLPKIMLEVKYRAQDMMSRLWPEPENSLLAGILYGSRSGLPKELVENFNRAGVSHIVAVSGYNISIIAMVLSVILIYLGLSRPKTFWLLAFLIFAFVFFTGATASVARAGSMAIIILAARHIGRLSSAGRSLVYAAVVMTLFNPRILVWDAGFQLSFLSTLGLVYLSPILENIAREKIKTKSSWFWALFQIFITTISAIIATAPLVAFEFGRFSVVAPMANGLILWLIPWLMLFGFLALILSFLFFPLGQAAAWLAGLGLRYVIIVAEWFGGKSWSAINIRIPVWVMLLMYTFIIYFVMTHTSSFIPPLKAEGRVDGLRS